MRPGTNGATSWLAASSAHVPGGGDHNLLLAGNRLLCFLGPLLVDRRVGIRSLCTLFPLVHYGLTALHALLGDQPGRPWCFEESAFIQA